MTVLVTGAAGFLGGNLLRCLAQEERPVVALVRELPDAGIARFLYAAPHRPVYNVASSIAHPLRDLVAILQQLAPEWRWSEATDGGPEDIALNMAQSRVPLNIARLRIDTGFAPAFTLETGLRDDHASLTNGESWRFKRHCAVRASRVRPRSSLPPL